MKNYIDTEIIKGLNPCKDRFENFTKHYPDFKGTFQEFLSLDNITYNDKVWVATRLFTKKQNVKFAFLCASSVLDLFEAKYPNDDRPRKALKAVKEYLVETTNENVAAAVHAAAYAAAAAGAYGASAIEKQKKLNLIFLMEASK